MTRRFRTYADVAEPAGAEIAEQVEAQFERLRARLSRIRNIVVVASGKGGVGKSFITANLAALLAENGRSIGVVDADLNGPSLVTMLGAKRAALRVDDDGVHPVAGRGGCRLISAELLLENADTPLRWHTSHGLEFLQQSLLETGALRELIGDVDWGDLDALIIDMPPGTDKMARLPGLIGADATLLMVTTPSRVTEGVVARSLTQAREIGIAQLGVVLNMDGFCCPSCGHQAPLFGAAAAPALDYWGRIPFDPAAAEQTDRGLAISPDSGAGRALAELAQRVQKVWS